MLAWVGKTRDRRLKELGEEYLRRAARLAPVSVRELKASAAVASDRRRREDMATLREASVKGLAVVLSERGEMWDTMKLSGFLRQRIEGSPSPTFFLCGGEEGFMAEDETWAGARLSLTRLTLPHELARVVLCEQVYRALSLLRNLKYHRS